MNDVLLMIISIFSVLYFITIIFGGALSIETEDISHLRFAILLPLYLIYWIPIGIVLGIIWLINWFWIGVKKIPKGDY